jgi:intraflagellar transport protein 122
VFSTKIQLLAFSGILEREWIMDSNIRYVKVISGPPKKECLLVGLKNGSVFKIFVDNGFPIPVVKIATPIKIVDISADKQKLAIIDDHNSLFVHDIKS